MRLLVGIWEKGNKGIFYNDGFWDELVNVGVEVVNVGVEVVNVGVEVVNVGVEVVNVGLDVDGYSWGDFVDYSADMAIFFPPLLSRTGFEVVKV